MYVLASIVEIILLTVSIMYFNNCREHHLRILNQMHLHVGPMWPSSEKTCSPRHGVLCAVSDCSASLHSGLLT